jgi:hypothetical protein
MRSGLCLTSLMYNLPLFLTLAASDWILGLMVSKSVGASQFKQGLALAELNRDAMLVRLVILSYYYITFNQLRSKYH